MVRTHPVTAPEGALRQSRLHAIGLIGRAARRERRHPALSLRAHGEPAVSVPLPLAAKTPSPSGTIAAFSTARCGTTGRTPAAVTASRSRETSPSDVQAPFAGAGHAKKAVLASDLRLRRRAGGQRKARLRTPASARALQGARASTGPSRRRWRHLMGRSHEVRASPSVEGRSWAASCRDDFVETSASRSPCRAFKRRAAARPVADVAGRDRQPLQKPRASTTCVASSGGLPDKMRRVTLGVTGLRKRFDGRIFSASQVQRGKPFPGPVPARPRSR